MRRGRAYLIEARPLSLWNQTVTYQNLPPEEQAKQLTKQMRKEGKTKQMISRIVLEAKVGTNPILVFGHTMRNCFDNLKPRLIEALDNAGFTILSARRDVLRFRDVEGNENSIKLTTPKLGERSQAERGVNAVTFYDHSVSNCARRFYVRHQDAPKKDDMNFFSESLGVPWKPSKENPETD